MTSHLQETSIYDDPKQDDSCIKDPYEPSERLNRFPSLLTESGRTYGKYTERRVSKDPFKKNVEHFIKGSKHLIKEIPLLLHRFVCRKLHP